MRLYWIVIRDTVNLRMEGRATILWLRGPAKGTHVRFLSRHSIMANLAWISESSMSINS